MRRAPRVELLFLGRTLERGRRRLALLDRLRHRVEIAGADFALVLDGREAAIGGGEFLLLKLDECAHLVSRVVVREIEHRIVERVEAGERDELEPVAVAGDLALELRDRRVVEVLLPVERRRAVVGEELPRIFRMDAFGEPACEFEIGLAGLAPDEIGIRRVREPAADRLVEPFLRLEEAFDRALAGAERLVVLVVLGAPETARGHATAARATPGR